MHPTAVHFSRGQIECLVAAYGASEVRGLRTDETLAFTSSDALRRRFIIELQFKHQPEAVYCAWVYRLSTALHSG